MSEPICEILRRGITLSGPDHYGWTKELNKVSWNGGEPKWDIRSWNDTHDRMSRGITLTDAEMEKLVQGFTSLA